MSNFGEIDASSAFWSSALPDLGLTKNLKYPFRVYLLKCAPQKQGSPFTWYVGLVHLSHLAQRMAKQMRGGCHFTRVHPPISVEIVWPTATRAAEAMLYYAMVEKLPGAALESGRLGGWTQTSTKLSPINTMQIGREKWMLEGACLDCGKGCAFGACQSSEAARDERKATYHCDHCAAMVRINNQGKSETEPPRLCFCPPCRAQGQGLKRSRDPSENEEASHSARRPPPQPRPSSAPAQAPQPSPSTAPALAPRALPLQRAPCLKVLVCGHPYATLKWFLGRREYPREVCAMAGDRLACSHAVLTGNGDAKTLVAAEFAHAQQPRELFPKDQPPGHRVRLPTAFVATACPAGRKTSSGARSELEAMKRPDDMQGYRGVLWRVNDVARVLAS